MKSYQIGLLTAGVLSVASVAWAGPPQDTQPRLSEDVAPHTGAADVNDPPADPSPPPVTQPEPFVCPYVRGDLLKTGYDATGAVKNPFQIYAAGANMSCVTTMINEIKNALLAKIYTGSGYWDDAQAFLFAKKYFSHVSSYNLGKDVEADEVRTTVSDDGAAICYQESFYHSNDGKPQQCSRGTIYFGPNCERVAATKVTAACGADVARAFEVNFLRSSPISLLWGDSADIEASISVVSFPIDPTYQNAWYTWKASESTPLLVHNPSHDGVIKSGTQLFGPWAFGGKRTAMNSDKGVAGTPWRDGYEALASLDANGDGMVSGPELEPLGLWFDKNQDAVSQTGEVKSLAEAGVTKLFYRSNRVDGKTSSIFADKGFERVENGKTITGGSVDWFADTAATPGELIGKHVLSADSLKAEPVENIVPAPAAPEAQPAAKAEKAQDPLAGIWQWSLSEQPSAGIQGYLIFSVNPSARQLRGYSLVGNSFAYTPKDVASEVVHVFGVEGGFEAAENGKRAVNFTSKLGGTRIRTEAELSSDGKMLTATTSAYIQKDRKYQKVTYRWTALKVS